MYSIGITIVYTVLYSGVVHALWQKPPGVQVKYSFVSPDFNELIFTLN